VSAIDQFAEKGRTPLNNETSSNGVWEEDPSQGPVQTAARLDTPPPKKAFPLKTAVAGVLVVTTLMGGWVFRGLWLPTSMPSMSAAHTYTPPADTALEGGGPAVVALVGAEEAFPSVSPLGAPMEAPPSVQQGYMAHALQQEAVSRGLPLTPAPVVAQVFVPAVSDPAPVAEVPPQALAALETRVVATHAQMGQVEARLARLEDKVDKWVSQTALRVSDSALAQTGPAKTVKVAHAPSEKGASSRVPGAHTRAPQTRLPQRASGFRLQAVADHRAWVWDAKGNRYEVSAGSRLGNTTVKQVDAQKGRVILANGQRIQ
jgi:hypothetical protein